MPVHWIAVWIAAGRFLTGKTSIRLGIWGMGKSAQQGVAMAMQGSCISNLDVGSATIRLSDDGTYNLMIGAADMGTGCDTILAQMAAGVSGLFCR